MAFIKVHGVKLANGSWIENAVVETISTPLTQEQINASALGRMYFDTTENALMTVVSDGSGGKTVKAAGALAYEPNLSSKILSAATSFQNADELLEANILSTKSDLDALTTRVTTAEGDIDALETKLDEALGNAAVFTFASSAPATTHTITHNLDADFVDVSVWVKDATSGLYAKDLCNVVEVDKNSVRVELTESSDIKATVHKITTPSA